MKCGKFLTSREAGSFSRRTLVHIASIYVHKSTVQHTVQAIWTVQSTVLINVPTLLPHVPLYSAHSAPLCTQRDSQKVGAVSPNNIQHTLCDGNSVLTWLNFQLIGTAVSAVWCSQVHWMRLCNICGHFVNTSIKKPDMIIFHTQLKATFMKKRKIRYYEKVKGKKKSIFWSPTNIRLLSA